MKSRRTKIVATMGPSMMEDTSLEQVIASGVNVIRVNFSHGTNEQHRNSIKLVRETAKKLHIELAIMADLQGPKIRIGKFKNGTIVLDTHQEFIIDTKHPYENGNENIVSVDAKDLPKQVTPKDTLLLSDGAIALLVTNVSKNQIHCTVLEGGDLKSSQGLNRLGGGLALPTFTDKDKNDLKIAADCDVDYIALSFVKDKHDINYVRELLQKFNKNISIVAKMERNEAIINMDEIIQASDAILVARGDLGVEIGDAMLPSVQKKLISQARMYDTAVIVATQMMESMITQKHPTRAEVFDVANAVIDGTDAVMLSGETAIGKHPEKVVAAMHRICKGAEKEKPHYYLPKLPESAYNRTDKAIAMACSYTAKNFSIDAIITLTESGKTALFLSRAGLNIPIFGLSQNIKTINKMCMYRDVYPIFFDIVKYKRANLSQAELNKEALKTIKDNNTSFKTGANIIITYGDEIGVNGGTNTMKILKFDSIN